MNPNFQTDFTVDRDAFATRVTRRFAAPRKLVWRAWTEPELLARWWAPVPWRAETRHMDMRTGGYWHYVMVGPENETHHGRADYDSVLAPEHIEARDSFVDDQGQPLPGMPVAKMRTEFVADGEETVMHNVSQYASLADLEAVLKMGMQEGFTATLAQLDLVLGE